jgi:hypothetical protein
MKGKKSECGTLGNLEYLSDYQMAVLIADATDVPDEIDLIPWSSFLSYMTPYLYLG